MNGPPTESVAPRVDGVGLRLIRLALEEDLAGYGDVTSAWTVDPAAEAQAHVVAREPLVVSGTPLAAAVLREVDPLAAFSARQPEGEPAAAGSVVAVLSGRAQSLLSAERTLLNLLTHLCGVATQSSRFSQAVAGTGAQVVDTRKTTAGLRYWEKRAVRHGGCGNHRFGLFDLVLIKDNHVAAGGGVGAAIARARAAAPASMKIEAEVEDEAALREALAAGADIVMLDNRSVEELTHLAAVARSLRPEVLLEASGGVALDGVRRIAQTGVDLISTSALTAGAPPVDLALDFV